MNRRAWSRSRPEGTHQRAVRDVDAAMLLSEERRERVGPVSVTYSTTKLPSSRRSAARIGCRPGGTVSAAPRAGDQRDAARRRRSGVSRRWTSSMTVGSIRPIAPAPRAPAGAALNGTYGSDPRLARGAPARSAVPRDRHRAQGRVVAKLVGGMGAPVRSSTRWARSITRAVEADVRGGGRSPIRRSVDQLQHFAGLGLQQPEHVLRLAAPARGARLPASSCVVPRSPTTQRADRPLVLALCAS